MTSLSHLRTDLGRLGLDPDHMTDLEVFHLASAIRGWHVTPRTPADAGPVDARVWLAAALGARGRYRTPEAFGHLADLHDAGAPVDSAILMAVVQRHFLALPALAWDDDSLAAQLGLDRVDVARVQAVLDAMQALVVRGAPPLGERWWQRAPNVPVAWCR